MSWRRRRARARLPEFAVTLRFASPDDEVALTRLAALDGAPLPIGPVLLAEVDGELRAALALRDGAVMADPFRPTVALLELLVARAAQLRATAAPARARVGAGSGRAQRVSA